MHNILENEADQEDGYWKARWQLTNCNSWGEHLRAVTNAVIQRNENFLTLATVLRRYVGVYQLYDHAEIEDNFQLCGMGRQK